MARYERHVELIFIPISFIIGVIGFWHLEAFSFGEKNYADHFFDHGGVGMFMYLVIFFIAKMISCFVQIPSIVTILVFCILYLIFLECMKRKHYINPMYNEGIISEEKIKVIINENRWIDLVNGWRIWCPHRYGEHKKSEVSLVKYFGGYAKEIIYDYTIKDFKIKIFTRDNNQTTKFYYPITKDVYEREAKLFNKLTSLILVNTKSGKIKLKKVGKYEKYI